MDKTDCIRAMVEPALAGEGLELWDVEIAGGVAGRVAGGVIRVLVDAEGGVDLDSLTRASAVLSPLFDDRPDVVPAGSYQLEVSSPGVERTLRTPDQYRRYVGSEINVKTSVPVEGSRRHRGRLLSVDADTIGLQRDDLPADRAPLELPYSQIDRARTILVWGPTPAPAARRNAGKHRATVPAAPAALDAKDAGL